LAFQEAHFRFCSRLSGAALAESDAISARETLWHTGDYTPPIGQGSRAKAVTMRRNQLAGSVGAAGHTGPQDKKMLKPFNRRK